MKSATTRSLALSLLACLCFTGHAFADDAIPTAESHLAELRFDEAKAVATAALDKGKNGPKDLARLYMVLGQIEASLGNDSDAEAAFLNALSIDATIELPAGVSPKLSEPFASAGARLTGAKPIALDFEQLEDGLLVVTVASDPANLVGGASLSYLAKGKGKPKTLRGTGRSTIEIVVPGGADKLKVTALDPHGNRLTAPVEVAWKQTSDAASTDVVSEKTSEKTGTGGSKKAIYEHWQIYAGFAGASLLGGLYLGKTAEDFAADVGKLEDGTEFSVAKKLEDKAESRALYANISFVGAGLFGAAAYWMYSRSSDSEKTPRPTTAIIVPTISSHSLGLGASLRF